MQSREMMNVSLVHPILHRASVYLYVITCVELSVSHAQLVNFVGPSLRLFAIPQVIVCAARSYPEANSMDSRHLDPISGAPNSSVPDFFPGLELLPDTADATRSHILFKRRHGGLFRICNCGLFFEALLQRHDGQSTP